MNRHSHMEASRSEYVSPVEAVAGHHIPPAPDPWDDDEPFDPWPTIAALWQRKRMLVAGTVAASAAALLVSLALPKQYTALATVFVTPPTLANDLKPIPLSVEAFERLANSDFIKNRVAQDLRQKKALGPDEAPGRFETIIYPSKEPQKPFLPIIGLQVVSDSPVKAETVANAWAAVLVEEETRISAIGKSGSVDFVLQEFPKASSQVLEEERKLKLIEDQQARVMTAAETRYAISLETAQLDSVEKQIVEFESELARAHVSAQQSKESIPRFEQELARTPQVLTTSKALSDDALWQSTANGARSGEPPRVPDALATTRLRSEEMNPVYLSLSQRLADERIAYNANVAREAILERQIRDAKARAATLRSHLLAGRQAIADLKRLQTLERSSSERAVNQARARFNKLNDKIGDAQIVKAESESDLKVGALAEQPKRPSSPDPLRNALVAAPVGLLLSALFLWLSIQMKRHSLPAR